MTTYILQKDSPEAKAGTEYLVSDKGDNDVFYICDKSIVFVTNVLYMKNRPPKDRGGIVSQMAEECIKEIKKK